jgi:uncharacterized NAD(P)/FAD-binding protein YdhS
VAAILRTIVIRGGGFSGTAVAIHLLRNPPRRPTRIVLIDRDGAFGRGLAYTERDFPYLLNVPAGRMSATAEAPLEFLQFAQRRYAQAGAHDFLPRAAFGDYLNELLIAAQLQSPRHVLLDRVKAAVVGVQRTERHLQLRVILANGQELYGDDVVLASGNPPPAELAACEAIRTSAAYFPEPWSRSWNLHPQRSALIIGTGLTMADVVFRSTAAPQLTPRMHALSRHGLIAPEQTQFRPDAFKGNGEALLLAASSSLRRLVDVTRILAAEAQSLGGDWREAVNFVRHMAPTLWQRLPAQDRQRFLRHLRSYWDIHRHRPAPQVLRRIREAQATGHLRVHGGRIREMSPGASGIRVRWTPRGRSETHELHVDQVINCTGPDYNPTAARDPLLRQLLTAGLITGDAHRLGIRTGANGAVIDRDGWPGPHLFYVGPMLRADHWEATAVAELRVHAARLASHLATMGESNGFVTRLERAS